MGGWVENPAKELWMMDLERLCSAGQEPWRSASAETTALDVDAFLAAWETGWIVTGIVQSA
jgi:hypothetical protein